jgi:hypothetical protein
VLFVFFHQFRQAAQVVLGELARNEQGSRAKQFNFGLNHFVKGLRFSWNILQSIITDDNIIIILSSVIMLS